MRYNNKQFQIDAGEMVVGTSATLLHLGYGYDSHKFTFQGKSFNGIFIR